METPRYLRCLGLPALFSPSGEPVRFRTKKHLALLVYLGVENRRSHPREHLAELLWPGVGTAEARHSLATALSVLRPRLGGEALQATRDQVSLIPGRLRLDLDRLLGGDVLGSGVTSPLEVANFLDGFEIPDAAEFAMWKDRQRARLVPAIKDALVLLIDRCRRTGDSRQIEQLADRMLGLDELSEEAIRAKMEARAFAGDRVGALKIFEAWREKLAQELGAVPSDLIEGMAMRLRRRGWERAPLADIPSIPTDQWKGRPFIGRTAEHRVLYEAWEDLQRGKPAHAFVLGDSGIGKTTLVQRLTTAAALEGAAISRVQCYDLERDIPYSTLGGLIHGLLDRPGVAATPPEALAEIARTVPEVRRRFPGLPDSFDSQGETARIRLTEAFHQMLESIVEEHPVILVVDDLHLADEASLAVLHLVMRRARGQTIMVMLVARPGELTHSPQAARLRESGDSLGICEVELTPLSAEESGDLLTALVPSDEPQPSASIRRALLRAAGGFPMVLELLTQDWQINGDQSLALAVDAMTAELEGGTGPTATYRHIIARILRTLIPQTHNVLSLAAVLGHRLNDLPMYGLIDLSLGQTMAGLSELSELRVLRDSSHGLEFVNELVRASAYASVPSSLRRALHSSVADRLLNDPRQRDAASGLEIAWHCIRAGREREATPYLLDGARDAIRRGAPDVAEHALSSALPGLSDPEATEARFLLVEVLQEQGQWMESLDMLGSIDLNNSGDRQHEKLVFSGLAKTQLGVSTAQEMLEHLPELTEIVKESEEIRTRARAARVVAYMLASIRDQKLCREIIEVVDRIPEASLDPDSLGHLALARALLLYESGRTAESLAVVEGALNKLRSLGVANLVMVQLQSGLGTISARKGYYEAALSYHEKAFKMAVSLGNDTLITSVAGNLALDCSRLGRHDSQETWLSQIPPSKAEFAGFVEVQIVYLTALNHIHKNRHDKADEVMTYLESRLVGVIPGWLGQIWSFYKADVLWLMGRRAEALRTAGQELKKTLDHLLSTAFAGPFARWVALTHQGESDPSGAYALLRGLLTNIEQYDAIDQAEILAAARMLQSENDPANNEIEKQLAERLLALPQAARAYLACFGGISQD